MEEFLSQYQFWILLTGLIIIPVIILALYILLGRKNHDIMGRILMGVAVVYLYDTFILGLSLLHLLYGTGSEYFIFAAIGLVPLIIGVALVLYYQGKLAWSGLGSRIIAFTTVYFLALIYILVMIFGISFGLGMMLLVGTVPIILGIIVFLLLRRNYIVVSTDEDEIVFLKEDYDEKEAYDYLNHL